MTIKAFKKGPEHVPLEEKDKYPWIGDHHGNGTLLVMFTSPGQGIMLCRNGESHVECGISSWQEPSYRPYKGQIVLENG